MNIFNAFTRRGNLNFVFLSFLHCDFALFAPYYGKTVAYEISETDKKPGFKIDIQKLSDETFCSLITEENKIYILEMCYNIQHVE